MLLVRVLDKKATRLEREDATARKAEWNKMLTKGNCGRKTTHGKALSRLAFQWIKKAASWEESKPLPRACDDVVADLQPGGKPIDEHDRTNPSAAVNRSDGEVLGPALDQAAVDNAAAQWADLWNATGEYQRPDLADADGEELPPLTPEDLRAAARTFSATSGLRVDSFSSKALARLPYELLQELADLLHAAENAGTWSDAMALVMLVLLPKDGGGHRPIG